MDLEKELFDSKELDSGKATEGLLIIPNFKDFKGKNESLLITEMSSLTMLLKAGLDHVISWGLLSFFAITE